MLSYICRTLLANKCWLAILGLTLTVYFNDDLFAWIEPLDSTLNVHEHHLGDRMKRNVDPVAHEQASSGESIRLARRILNESESFVEKDGKKVPIDLKSLNKDYVEARKRFYAPPPACRNRTAAPPPPAPGTGPAAAPPPPAEGETPAAPPAESETPPAPPAEGEAPPPPGDRRRRKREAKELPYCDELNKKPTAAPAGAPPAPAESESPAAAPPPPVEGETPAAAPAEGDAPPPAAD